MDNNRENEGVYTHQYDNKNGSSLQKVGSKSNRINNSSSEPITLPNSVKHSNLRHHRRDPKEQPLNQLK